LHRVFGRGIAASQDVHLQNNNNINTEHLEIYSYSQQISKQFSQQEDCQTQLHATEPTATAVGNKHCCHGDLASLVQ